MSGVEEVVVPAKNLRLSLMMLSHSSIQVIKYQAESSARHRQLWHWSLCFVEVLNDLSDVECDSETHGADLCKQLYLDRKDFGR